MNDEQGKGSIDFELHPDDYTIAAQEEAADKLAKVLSDRIEGIVYDDESTTVASIWTGGSRARCAAPSGKAPMTGMPAS